VFSYLKCFVHLVPSHPLPSHPTRQVDFSYLKCLEKIFPLPKRAGDRGATPGSKKRRREDGPSGDGKRFAAEGAGSSPTKAAAPVEYTKGQIVVIKELADGLDFKALSAKFGDKEGGVAFVEVVPDMPLAYVRFNSADKVTTSHLT
jgi:hypothetical protein